MLTFIDPTIRGSYGRPPTATVYSNYRLIFNRSSELSADLKVGQRFIVAMPDNTETKEVFLIDESITQTIEAPPPVEIRTNGKYVALRFKNILRQMGLDYDKENKIVFDVVKEKYLNFDMIRLTLRKL